MTHRAQTRDTRIAAATLLIALAAYLIFLILTPGCPIRIDPPTEAVCADRPNCGLCSSEDVCVWCPGTGTCVGATAEGSCDPITVVSVPELCEGAVPE